MSKRVYELAKELGINVNELVEFLARKGVKKKSLSSLSDEEIGMVLAEFGRENVENSSEKRDREESVEEVFHEEIKDHKETQKRDSRRKGKKKKDKPFSARRVKPTEYAVREEEKEKVKEKKESRRTVVKVKLPITVNELSKTLSIPQNKIIGFFFKMGEKVTINTPLGRDEVMLVADEFGRLVEVVDEEEKLEELFADDSVEERMVPRPPVVVVMGHVDHGKTTLLDTIRKTRVAPREAGGITQKITASEVEVEFEGSKRIITFIDTPGHEAFAEMRARGAEVADIAILVVAANEGVRPQTVESIAHIREAGIKMIVAINKIDMPESNPERVRAELLEHGINCYEHGDVVSVEISAKKNINIDQLLEEILLMAEVYEFKADPEARPFAYVLESEVSRAGKGVWVIVKRGTLRKGQHFVVGSTYGTVQILRDHADRPAEAITPGRPGFVVYVESLPLPGEPLYVVESKKQAEELAKMFERKKGVRREKGVTTLEKLSQMLKEHKIKKLKLILKADKMGTVNTLKAAIEKYKTKNEEAEAEVIYGGVGEVTRTDVELAASSGAVVIAFNVKVPQVAKKAASVHGVQIRPYSVIYEVLDDVKQALLGLLSPERKRVLVGELEVLRVFLREKKRVVFGGIVRKGEARRGAEIELVRNGEVVYKGKVSSLRRFQEDVKSVPEGQECGIAVADGAPIEEGDKVYFFDWVEEKPGLDYIVEKK